MSLNRFEIIGFLGGDPRQLARLSVVTTEIWRDSAGTPEPPRRVEVAPVPDEAPANYRDVLL